MRKVVCVLFLCVLCGFVSYGLKGGLVEAKVYGQAMCFWILLILDGFIHNLI